MPHIMRIDMEMPCCTVLFIFGLKALLLKLEKISYSLELHLTKGSVTEPELSVENLRLALSFNESGRCKTSV